MDKDELFRRWAPIGPVTGGTVPSYQAKGKGGQFVQVHRVPDGTPESDRLSPLIERVQGYAPPDLVEVVRSEGGTVVVTHILPGNVTLEEWLSDSVTRAETESGAAQEEAPAPAGPAENDYSAYFRIPTSQDAPPTPPSPAEPADPSAPASPEGEDGYTSFFKVPEDGTGPAAPQSPKEKTSPPGYTDLFRAPPPDQKEPPPEPQPPPGQVKAPPAAPRAPAPKDQAPSRPSTSPSSSDSDSITDMFRRPEVPSHPTQDRSRREHWGEAPRELSPLSLSLDEYLRRLTGGVGHAGPGRREARGYGGGQLEPPPRSQDWGDSPGAGSPARPSDGVALRPPANPSKDLVVLVSILAFVVVVAVSVVLVVLLRGG